MGSSVNLDPRRASVVLALLAALAAALVLPAPASAASRAQFQVPTTTAADFRRLEAKAKLNRTVPVIVALAVDAAPEHELTSSARTRQRRVIGETGPHCSKSSVRTVSRISRPRIRCR